MSNSTSTLILNKLPPKKQDLGAPLISCTIGNITSDRALLDLGASINVIPTSLHMELGLGYLKHTDITFQLAYRSITKPRGILEDVLVKVNDLHYLADFMVLDMEAPK